MIFPLYKPAGQTPLEAMENYRAQTPILLGEPMVYAGRLDPMAEGVLLILTGEDRHALAANLTHDKEYVATMLFGVQSDTHDALGRLDISDGSPPPMAICAGAVGALKGTWRLPLPAWSAFRVQGRPLHAWAREERLHEIAIPARDMVVTSVSDTTAREVLAGALLDNVRIRIESVQGNFRQQEALADWQNLAQKNPLLVEVTTTLTVTSGTYIRALAHHIGEQLGCGGLLFALRRTRVGPFVMEAEAAANARDSAVSL